MSSFGRKGKIARLLRTLVGIETLELLGISPANLVTTTDNQFVTTTNGEFIKDST